MSTVFWIKSLGVDVVHQTVILSHCHVSMRSRWHSGKPLCALFWGEQGEEWHVFGTTGNAVLRRLKEEWTSFLSPSNNQLENIRSENTPIHNSHENIKYLGLNSVRNKKDWAIWHSGPCWFAYHLPNTCRGSGQGRLVQAKYIRTEPSVYMKDLGKCSEYQVFQPCKDVNCTILNV